MAPWDAGTEVLLTPNPDDPNYTLRAYPDQIKYAGVVDFENLYRTMIEWFTSRKYDFYETLYKDKPPELELEWVAKRKLDEFYQHRFELYFHLYDVKEVEAIKDGIKKKMIYCRMAITFRPILRLDWQDKWKGSTFLKMLYKFYFKNVIYREFQLKYADTLYYLYYGLHNKVKECLGMESATNAY
jgi:hypothetical protein